MENEDICLSVTPTGEVVGIFAWREGRNIKVHNLADTATESEYFCVEEGYNEGYWKPLIIQKVVRLISAC